VFYRTQVVSVRNLEIYAAHGGTMTDLRDLLAHNMKERRRSLKMTQYRLAEKAQTSAYYITMIENKKKYPSPEMLKRIAAGLDLDTPELFSVKSGYITETIKNYKKDVLKVISETTNSILERKLEQLKKK
jgi:transcriptional regulator with XRE-family HTH domain